MSICRALRPTAIILLLLLAVCSVVTADCHGDCRADDCGGACAHVCTHALIDNTSSIHVEFYLCGSSRDHNCQVPHFFPDSVFQPPKSDI